MVQCDTHGLQPALRVSKDIERAISDALPMPPFREINYIYDSEPLMMILISELFASANAIPNEDQTALPDQYPGWHDNLAIMCEVCINKAVN